MRISDILASLGGAFAHRVRAALTLLGVVIGTASIVLLASLLKSGETFLQVADQEASNGDVVEAYEKEPPPEKHDHTTRPLTRTDADTVANGAPFSGSLVAAETNQDKMATFEGRRKRVAVVSATSATLSLYRLRVEFGRPLDPDDRAQASRVAVIGHEVYDRLFLNKPLDTNGGLRIEIEGNSFTVVGVLAKKPMMGNTDSTYLWDRKMLIPETTYDALYATEHVITRVYVRRPGQDALGLKQTRGALFDTILRRHFGVENFEIAKDENGGTAEMIITIIKILLLGTGGLALLASGINIMNVMLVTVSERTREIGLRRALGATPKSVLLQFLLEAASLSLVGALVGVAVGVGLSWISSAAVRAAVGPNWGFAVPAWSMIVGVGMALGTGLAFGVMPAWRASKVSPIEALRSE